MGSRRAIGAWTCQLIRAELVSAVLVLDMIDIDDDPYDTAPARPRGPFTLHVGPGRELSPDSTCVMNWAARADVITMIVERSGDVDRLAMSNGVHELVLEISDTAGEFTRRAHPTG